MFAALGGCVVLAWRDGSPVVPTDAGRGPGGSAWGFLILLVLAFGAYLAGLALLRRGSARLAAVAALAVAIQLAPLAAPLLLSTDAWTYWEYGELANAGLNPYTDPPSARPDAAPYEYAGARWRDTTTVYGPAFTLASQPLAAAAGSSADAAAWIYKLLAAGAALAAAFLASRLSRTPAFALAFAGWNPLLAVHLAGGGHNDAWVAALVVGALALGAAGRTRLAGIAWAAAILVKWVPAIFLVLRALEARAQRRRVSHGAFALALAALVALSTWRYGLDWLRAFGPLARNASGETSFALPHRLGQAGLPQAIALGLAVACLTVGLALLARRALRGRARLGLAACLLLATTPWLAAWYTAWAVPLAAAEDDDLARGVSLVLCAYLLPQAIPL